MEYRRILLLFLLVTLVGTAVCFRNGPNLIRRVRRIGLNEYLVPPPPPKFPSRTGRLTVPQPVEKPGYFSQLMNWLNPFNFGSSSPAPDPHPEASYSPPSPKFVQQPPPTPLSSANIYSDSSLPAYDRPPPPPPPPAFNNRPEYPPAQVKIKTCNSCNKIPWVPIQHGDVSHSGDASYVSPSSISPPNGGYLPLNNHEVAHDAHHAASQQVRAPDFSFVSPLPTATGQNVPLIGSLPNPHLYVGSRPIPPLFKPTDFNYPVHTTVRGNSKYLGTPSSSISGNHAVQNDLSSSGTQVSNGHTNPALSKQEFENIATHQGSINPTNHQIHYDSSSALNHQPSGLSNNEGFYDVTGPSGSLSNFLNNSSPIDQSSYGISSFDRIPNSYENRYNDLSSVDNIAKDSLHASLQTSGSPTTITDSIHFEESPLLDLTHKGESLTGSSSIPSTSNALADFNESVGTTLAPDDEIFRAHQDITSIKINGSVTQNSNRDLYGSKPLQEQELAYIPLSSQTEFVWPNVLSTTLGPTDRESFLSSLEVKPYEDVREEASNENVNSKYTNQAVQQQNVKRNKQVQIIIPYTSQYTPLPFHPSRGNNYGQKVSYPDKFDRDNYISEESRNQIKVADLPDSSHTFQSWPTTLTILQDIAKKSTGSKMNNSIDVHRLQKNIDNWTIQEYSKGTTVSTVSPSSANPYLYPSKQIPDEYLTTTESVNHTDDPNDNNVKTFALAGFNFNDLEHEGSASNHVESSRIQVLQSDDSQSTENSVDATRTSTKNDITWQDFTVDISPVNKERVYVVTPQPIVTTPKSDLVEQKKERAAKEVESNSTESVSETDTKKTEGKDDTFESIEKAYQVLPQAVNNLAVASTGPENVPLWGIMEHEEFASLDHSESDKESSESSENPVLYTGHSKVSRAKR